MKRLFLGLALFFFLLASVSISFAQNAVVTEPYGATNHNDSTTITATNTFQSIWAASDARTGRVDCIVQNNGAAVMYIFFGPIASAVTPNSLQLIAGSIFKCGNSGVVGKDQISITGTSGQRFFAIQY